jgi:hypothetical protein
MGAGFGLVQVASALIERFGWPGAVFLLGFPLHSSDRKLGK